MINQENIRLWILKDESLYIIARALVRDCQTKDHAAKEMLETLKECGILETPDHTPYTYTSIRYALRDF